MFYYVGLPHDRQWLASPLGQNEEVLNGTTLARLGASAHCNPGALGKIRSLRPDLVVVSDYSAPTSQALMWWLTLRGTPWIFWGEIPGFSERGRAGRWLRRRLQDPLRFAAAIAAIGERAASAYRDRFPKTPIYNIPYFCDLEPYRRAASKRRAVEECRILFSGQMIPRKGVDVLLDAFARLAETRPQARLLLLGDGPDKAAYMNRLVPSLRDRVTFLGHRQPPDIPAVFAEADIFCLPSRHDGWGVVVNEALGAGLPIVASDGVGAAHDLVQHGSNGYVVPVEDAEALAAALSRMIDDEALRSRFAAASKAAADHWDIDQGVARWRRAFDEVATRTPRQRR